MRVAVFSGMQGQRLASIFSTTQGASVLHTTTTSPTIYSGLIRGWNMRS